MDKKALEAMQSQERADVWSATQHAGVGKAIKNSIKMTVKNDDILFKGSNNGPLKLKGSFTDEDKAGNAASKAKGASIAKLQAKYDKEGGNRSASA
jgi:hypothetical protein